MEDVPIISTIIYVVAEVSGSSDDCGSHVLAAVDLPAGRSYDIVWCRRQREETRLARICTS